MNYLLIEALDDIDPALRQDIRDRLVNTVESDWRATSTTSTSSSTATRVKAWAPTSRAGLPSSPT